MFKDEIKHNEVLRKNFLSERRLENGEIIYKGNVGFQYIPLSNNLEIKIKY